MDLASVKKLKVQELKDALAERGLDTTGLKPVLVERLETALQGEQQQNGATAPNGTAEAAEEPHVDITAPDTATAEAPAAAAAAAAAVGGPERAASGGAPKTELSNQELLKSMPEEEKKKLRAQRFGGSGAGVGPLSKIDLAEEIRKRKERAKKFGLPMPVFAAEEELKKRQRRERFGLPPTPEEQAKMEAAAKAAAAKELADKKKARAERFGLAEETKPVAPDETAEANKAAARAKRFGSDAKSGGGPAAKKAAITADPAMAAKLKARAERFGVPTK